jgi:hypothetical protein
MNTIHLIWDIVGWIFFSGIGAFCLTLAFMFFKDYREGNCA